MINDVPAAIPVTKPPALIVALSGVPLDQVPPAVASVSWMVDPTHTVAVPVIAAGAAGNAFTVTVLVALTARDPFVVNFKMT